MRSGGGEPRSGGGGGRALNARGPSKIAPALSLQLSGGSALHHARYAAFRRRVNLGFVRGMGVSDPHIVSPQKEFKWLSLPVRR